MCSEKLYINGMSQSVEVGKMRQSPPRQAGVERAIRCAAYFLRGKRREKVKPTPAKIPRREWYPTPNMNRL